MAFPQENSSPRDTWCRRLTGPAAAGLVLVLFWAGLLGSLRHKSITFDEMAHATAGYSYWRFNDYRLNPENGNLPQRIMALPLVLGGSQFEFPPLDSPAWRTADEWAVGDQWFHHMGHDVSAMLFRGRAVMGLVAVALAALVWLWSRRLFGPVGGMISLLLCVLSPIVLANGALMTSDTTAAFFFLASAWSLWAAAHRISVARLLVSGLCLGGLFAAKMSALLILPLALILWVVRIVDGRPLPVGMGRTREFTGRGRQALLLFASALIQVAIAWTVLWACYGFRYAAFAQAEAGRDQFQRRWEVVLGRDDPVNVVLQLDLSAAQRAQVLGLLQDRNAPAELWAPARVDALPAIRHDILSPAQIRELDRRLDAPSAEWPVRAAEFVRRHRLLPEAYVYGQTYAWRYSQTRFAFLNGEYSTTGEQLFFPYAFLVKTPLAMFAVAVLALAAFFRFGFKLRQPGRLSSLVAWPGLYGVFPLLLLFVLYWMAVLFSHLNIGHRHILATYPLLFVLCGAGGLWLAAHGRTARMATFAIGVLLVAMAGEMAYRFPNYLAYFNAIAGGPAQGYRHLVDSSLDWGQELPAVKAYLDRHAADGPAYFSYFGIGDPASYAISANRLYSAPGQDLPPPLFTISVPAKGAGAAVAEVRRQHPGYEAAGAVPGGNETLQVIMLKTPDALRWKAGTYVISATMLQPINYVFSGPIGPWNGRFESIYQDLVRTVGPLLGDDTEARFARLREHSPAEWEQILTRFEAFRFARLTAWLRRREPNDMINDSVLVYRLGDADLEKALGGMPAEIGEDLPAQIERAAAAEKGGTH